MAKRSEPKNTKYKARQAIEDPTPDLHHTPPTRAPLEALTETQRLYRSAILSSELIFGVGPAGTGKTYLPTAIAAEALASKRISNVIISRPAIEAGETLGFLPGELDDKFAPYLAPFQQIFTERMGTGPFQYAVKAKKIEAVPIGFMRGRTFNDCFLILDEAQNITPKQMMLVLTRIGKNCKVVVCGDTDQCDITGPSGLTDAIERTRWIKSVRVVEFTRDDVVRSGMVKNILLSYAKKEISLPG